MATFELLATGFGPFRHHEINPSWAGLEAARPQLPPHVRLRRELLDVDWTRARGQLAGAITADTRWVIAFGVADDADIRIERFALNAADRDAADVNGTRFGDDRLCPGPPAYETRLPRLRLLRRLQAAGLRARESHYAGSYLCNFVFYHMMHHAAQRPDLVAGFVHVPAAELLPVAETARAIALALETVAADDVS
jgi:pyroglutamyl-peptidase